MENTEMENTEVKETKNELDTVKESLKKERMEELAETTSEIIDRFTSETSKINLNLLMPESVFVNKYLPLFARLAVNKDLSVMDADEWKEWISMTVGGTREVGIVADSELNLSTENEMVSETSEFPYKYASHSIDPNSVNVLYKVPPIISGIAPNMDAIKEEFNKAGVSEISDTATIAQSQINYTPARGESFINMTLGILGRNAIPDHKDYKERWKDILYRYYKPKSETKQVVDKEEEDKEYDELW